MRPTLPALVRCARIAHLSESLATLAPLGSPERGMRRAEAARAYRLLDAARADAAALRASALGIREPKRY